MIWRDVAKYGPSIFLLVASFFLASEIDWIDRTLGASRLYGGAAAAGALIALLVAPGLLRYAMLNETRANRVSYVITLCVCLSGILVSVASIVNRAFAPSFPSAEVTYQLVAQGRSSGRGKSPFIVLATQYGQEKFSVALTLDSSSNAVRVTTNPGNLGFDRVIRFEALQ